MSLEQTNSLETVRNQFLLPFFGILALGASRNGLVHRRLRTTNKNRIPLMVLLRQPPIQIIFLNINRVLKWQKKMCRVIQGIFQHVMWPMEFDPPT